MAIGGLKPRHESSAAVLLIAIVLCSFATGSFSIPYESESASRKGRKLSLFLSSRPSVFRTVAGSLVSGPALISRSFGTVPRNARSSVEVDSSTGVAFVLDRRINRWIPIDPFSGRAIIPVPTMEFDAEVEQYFIFIPSTRQQVYIDASTGRPLSVLNNRDIGSGFRNKGFNLNVGGFNAFNDGASQGVRIGNAFTFFNGGEGTRVFIG